MLFSAEVRVPAVALSGLVRRKEGFEVTTDPGGDGAFAVHGPRNHRAVIDVLDEARDGFLGRVPRRLRRRLGPS